MTLPLQRNRTPNRLQPIGGVDFSRPIELLMDCHRRIEHFLADLLRIVAADTTGRLADVDRPVLATALNYFQQAAPRHTTDEEQSLFPRLRQCAAPALRTTLAELDQLESEHRQVAVVHAQIAEFGDRWLHSGQLAAAEVRQFRSLLAELTREYSAHIRVEDERVYATAVRVLTAEELRAVGAEMNARRTADPGRAGSRCADRRRLRAQSE